MPHVISGRDQRDQSDRTQHLGRDFHAQKAIFRDGVNALIGSISDNPQHARRIFASLSKLGLSTEERSSIQRIISKLPVLDQPVPIDLALVKPINISFKTDLWEAGARSVEELSRPQFLNLVAKRARVTFADAQTPFNTDGASLFKAFSSSGFSRAEQVEVFTNLLRSRTALFRQAAAAGEDLSGPRFTPDLHATIAGAGHLGNLPGKRAIGALTSFLTETPSNKSFLLGSAMLRALGSLQHIAGAAEKKEGGLGKHLLERKSDFESMLHSFRTSGERILESETARLIQLLPRS